MKKVTTLVIFLFAARVLLGQTNCPPNPIAPVNVYCEDGKGIATDPNNPVNSECPNLTNNFNWMLKTVPGDNNPEYYYIYPDNDPNAYPIEIWSPFKGPGAVGPPDGTYLHWITQSFGSNYNPEDGWELLKMEFGSNGNIGLGPHVLPGTNSNTTYRPKLPYMILYNRYTGTLRFFGSILDPNQDYSTIRIELRVPKNAPKPKLNDPPNKSYQEDLAATNLLSIQGKSIQPLDKQSDETALTVFVPATNNEKVFFWFDAPMAYDPCVCNNRAQLDVDFRYVQTADIEIVGTVEGSIKTVNNGANNYGAMVFSRVIAAGASVVTAYLSKGTIVNFKAFTDLVDIAKGPSGNSDLDALQNYLGCAANYAKVIKGNYSDISSTDEKKKIKAGQKILDGTTTFLSSAVKGCGSGDKGSTVITGNINAVGTFTMTSSITGDEITLAIPGSDWKDKTMETYPYTENDGKIVPAYPTYNERLGTFSLLKTPRLLVKESMQRCEDVEPNNPNSATQNAKFYERRNWSLKLVDEAIEYAFNPKMNLNKEKTTILARLVVHKDVEYFNKGGMGAPNEPFCDPTPSTYYSALNFEHNADADYILATPYMPLDYITNLPMRISWSRLGTTNNKVYVNKMRDFAFEFDEVQLEDNMYIQFSIVGESYDIGSDGTPNDFVQVLTFPVKSVEQTTDPIQGQITGNYESGIKEYDSDQFFFYESDKYFEGPVIISAKLESAPEKIRIYSLNGFQIMPGAEISRDVELITGPHFPARPQPERTYAQINAVCSDPNKYRAQTFANKALLAEKAEYDHRRATAERNRDNGYYAPEIRFELMPNPTNGMTTIRWSSSEIADQTVLVSVVDISGTEVVSRRVSVTDELMQFDLSDLSNGVYMVQLKTESGYTGIRKLVKQ